MVDKISDLSIDRIFSILGRGQMPISPEKVIIYGLFFIGVVIFVNWIISVTVIVVRPFLYAALMIAILRPELIQYLTTEDAVIKLIDMVKKFVVSFALGLMDLLQILCEQLIPKP